MLLRPFYGRLFFSPDGDSGGGETAGDQVDASSQQGETSDETTSEGTDEAATALAAAKANNARLDQLLKNSQRELAAAKAAEKKRTEDAAKEQGDFKALHESAQTTIAERDTRIAELEGQIQAAEHTSLRTRIAAKHKLPADLADLLRGDDEAALEASAKTLAKHIRTDAPDTEAGQNRSRQQTPNRQAAKVEPGKTVDGAQKVAWPT